MLDPDLEYPDVPTLILSGDLDSITPIGEATLVAEAIGPSATLVEVAASTHVTALGDTNACASVLVNRFVVDHDAGDTSCASGHPGAPPGRLVPPDRRRCRPATAHDRRRLGCAIAGSWPSPWTP